MGGGEFRFGVLAVVHVFPLWLEVGEVEAFPEGFRDEELFFPLGAGADVSDCPASASEVVPPHSVLPEALQVGAELGAGAADQGLEFGAAVEGTFYGHADEGAAGIGDVSPRVILSPAFMGFDMGLAVGVVAVVG